MTRNTATTYLIVCFRFIGDVLVTTPLAASIKRAFPGALVDYLVFEGTEAVLEHNPHINSVITVPREEKNVAILGSLFRKYDIAIGAYPSDRTLVAAATAGNHSICLTYGKGMWWKRLALDASILCDDRQHVVTNMLGVLGQLGIPPLPEVVAGYDDDDVAFARYAMPASPYVVLHPYSRNSCKFWPAQAWGKLAALILQHTGCSAVFTRTPTAQDSVYLDQIKAAAPAEIVTFKEACSLSRLAAAIKGSVAYVGIDTAVTHLAAAVGVTSVAIFGPSLTRYWAPWPNGCQEASPFAVNKGVQRSGNVTVVQKDWACVPCNRESCAISTRGVMECLEQLSPEEVFAELDRIIHQRGV